MLWLGLKDSFLISFLLECTCFIYYQVKQTMRCCLKERIVLACSDPAVVLSQY